MGIRILTAPPGADRGAVNVPLVDENAPCDSVEVVGEEDVVSSEALVQGHRHELCRASDDRVHPDLEPRLPVVVRHPGSGSGFPQVDQG